MFEPRLSGRGSVLSGEWMRGNDQKNKGRLYFIRYWQLYVMMALPLLYFLLFKYVPMFGNVLAFRRYRPGMGPFGTEWVGLTYFRRFWSDPAFWRAFRNTLVLSLINLVVNFPIPIIFAILLNEVRIIPFKRMVQTVSYMPRFISTVVVIAILGELLSPSSGIFNILRQQLFGKAPIYFINEEKYFRIIYVLIDTWQYTGWTAIIYLAAITGISPTSTRRDHRRASRTQQIFYVTIPSIMPTIMVMLILNIGRLLSLGFEKVLLLYTLTTRWSATSSTPWSTVPAANQNYSCHGNRALQRHSASSSSPRAMRSHVG